ncbi:hypothetical protein ACROYT_G033278 [Oculina patagonica]
MQNQEKSSRYSPYFIKKSQLQESGQDAGGSNETSNLGEQNQPGKSPKKQRRAVKRFGEMSEEDVLKLKLPEHLDYNLDILFVGINPGLMAAYKGHHYAGANNHFWRCLYESGLVPERLTYLDDVRCPSRYGIGLTNMVERTTRGSADLSRQEMRDGKDEFIRKVVHYKPLIVCFNGKVIYELFSGSKCTVGRQKDPIPGTNTAVYVMPSTSGRTQTYPRATDKIPFFTELKTLREEVKSKSADNSCINRQ